MISSKFHKIIGITLVIPMFAWAITGMIFFIKPGYDKAYEQLQIRTYPLDKFPSVEFDSTWISVKAVKTILGNHLLIRTDNSSLHFNATTNAEFKLPEEEKIRLLVNDAIKDKAERYGQIDLIDKNIITTSTDVKLTLYWESLSLYQYGNDTKLIDTIYKIHYLQWTGVKAIDNVLGFIGLALIILLTILGIRLIFRK